MKGAPSPASHLWYLAAMAAIKDEAPYLDEWLAFCASEGVEHILLYDNGSTDHTPEVLRPWINAGFVTVIDWPVHWKQGAQTRAYADALNRLRGKARWVAFIDPDEFLFSPTGRTVADVMQQYEGHAGVIVNWQCFGSSGHKVRPNGLTIESYTRRAHTDWARNRRVKTIVDPGVAVEPDGSHLFRVVPGQALVTEDFKPVRVVRSIKWRPLRRIAVRIPYLPFDPYSSRAPSPRQVSVRTLRINHYVTRSKQEVASKYKDRNSMRAADRDFHARYHDRNEVEDRALVSQAGLVRQIIDRVRATNPPAKLSEWVAQARANYAFEYSRLVVPAAVAPTTWLTRLDRLATSFRRDLRILWLAARNPRVPWSAKVVAGLVGGYPLWPIDIIPDVVPILGYVDDLIIVPLGLFLASRLIPADVMAELRLEAARA